MTNTITIDVTPPLEESEEDKCRICLESGKEKLEKRCNCNNLCHDSCLVYWIKTRPQNQDNLICEICKSPYTIDSALKNLIYPKQSFFFKILKLSQIYLAIIIPIWIIFLSSWLNSNLDQDKKNQRLEFTALLTLSLTIYYLIIVFCAIFNEYL